MHDIGSGITLYMTLVYTTNFTVSIDGSIPMEFFFNAPPGIIFNFTAYDQQTLQFGNHNLDLMLQDTNETADAAHNSNFLFDYASIYETMPSPGGTTSLVSSSSVSSSSVSSSSVSSSSVSSVSSASPASTTKGAVAGAIAGVAGIAIISGLYYLYRRRAGSAVSNSRNLPVTEAIAPFPLCFDNPIYAQRTPQDTSMGGPTMTSAQYPSSASTSNVVPSLLPPASLPLNTNDSTAPATLSHDQ